MKHLIVFPLFSLLVVLSMTLGLLMYLWKFSKKDFFKGCRFINTKVVRFVNWYDLSSNPPTIKENYI